MTERDLLEIIEAVEKAGRLEEWSAAKMYRISGMTYQYAQRLANCSRLIRSSTPVQDVPKLGEK